MSPKNPKKKNCRKAEHLTDLKATNSTIENSPTTKFKYPNLFSHLIALVLNNFSELISFKLLWEMKKNKVIKREK